MVVYDPAGSGPAADGARPVTSAEQAVAAADAAVIASPSSEHLEHARLALEHGCHVLVEKPLSTAPSGVLALIALAQANERILAVGFNLRFHPGPSGVRELVRAGTIGAPMRAEITFGSWLPGWRPQTDYRTSYSARSELGGGVLLDAIHELDYAAWILGDAVEVGAWLERLSDLEIDVEDTALLTLRHAGGAISTVALDYLDRGYRRGCRVIGSEGSIDWRWADEHLIVSPATGAPHVRPAPGDVADAYRLQTTAFLEAVELGAIPAHSSLCDGPAGAHTVEIASAARRSSGAGGGRVRVGPEGSSTR